MFALKRGIHPASMRSNMQLGRLGRCFSTVEPNIESAQPTIKGFVGGLPRFEDISTANYRIRSHGKAFGKQGGAVDKTECRYSPWMSDLLGMDIWFKCEFRHRTGSFKERGARNALMKLSPEQKAKVPKWYFVFGSCLTS